MRGVDLCAGPGGMSEGIRLSGIEISMTGIEIDPAACATARAAGHRRIQMDMRALDPRAFAPIDYLHASPPCQGFSAAGKGLGRGDADLLIEMIRRSAREDVDDLVREMWERSQDHRSILTLHPMRWIKEGDPTWVSMEQVPTVLSVWQAYAQTLREMGWSAWAGKLRSETYGVPQSRARAVLLARRDGIEATPPPVTHSRFYPRDPERLDPGVRKWVSMGEVLGHLGQFQMLSNYSTHGDYSNRGVRTDAQPAPTVTSKADRNRLEFGDVRSGRGTMRSIEHPAPTITSSTDNGNYRFRVNGSRANGARITRSEAGALQSFPADYPWVGNKEEAFTQIGNAVPPLMARAIVTHLLSSA